LLIAIFPLGVGISTFVILKTLNTKRKPLLILVIVLGTIFLQMTLHPVSTSGSLADNTWVEIYEYSAVYFQYPDNVQYEDLAFGKDKERIAASVKYRDSLPNRLAVILVYKDTRFGEIENRYFIELKNNAVSYDKSKFRLEQREDTIYYLITDLECGEHIDISLRTVDIMKLFSPYNGVGWASGTHSFNIYSPEFIPETGAEKLFYKALSLR